VVVATLLLQLQLVEGLVLLFEVLFGALQALLEARDGGPQGARVLVGRHEGGDEGGGGLPQGVGRAAHQAERAEEDEVDEEDERGPHEAHQEGACGPVEGAGAEREEGGQGHQPVVPRQP
jgi:hypothetical protein